MADIKYNRLRLAAGSRIFDEGDAGDCAYLIERGRVEVSGRRDGIRKVLKTLGPGEMFGELAVLDDMPRSATATTLEVTELTVIERDQLRSRLDDAAPVVRLLFETILETFRHEQYVRTGRIEEASVLSRWPGTSPAAFSNGAVERLRLGSDLAGGLDRSEFELHYQPIVDLPGRRLAGFEALIRWHHPERGLISPADFVPLAEETGIIVPMGLWILGQACRALARFQAGLGSAAPLFLSVNVSPRQLAEADLVASFARVLKETGTPAERIKLEITESLLMSDPEHAAETLAALKALGFRLAIDDFGTGYSSLSVVHDYPFDTLKIDQSFVGVMDRDGRSREMVRAICQLARAFDLDIIAEGVETPEQAAALTRLGPCYAQGYLVARPLTEEAAQRFSALRGGGRRPRAAPPPVAGRARRVAHR